LHLAFELNKTKGKHHFEGGRWGQGDPVSARQDPGLLGGPQTPVPAVGSLEGLTPQPQPGAGHTPCPPACSLSNSRKLPCAAPSVPPQTGARLSCTKSHFHLLCCCIHSQHPPGAGSGHGWELPLLGVILCLWTRAAAGISWLLSPCKHGKSEQDGHGLVQASPCLLLRVLKERWRGVDASRQAILARSKLQ